MRNVSIKKQTEIPFVRSKIIQRSIIHGGQQLCISRCSIRISHLQGPRFLTSRLKFVTESRPLQLQFLIRLRFLDSEILMIKLAILDECHRYHDTISIFFLIIKIQAKQGIRQCYLSAFQTLVTREYVIEYGYVLFYSAEIKRSRESITRLIIPLHFITRHTSILQ